MDAPLQPLKLSADWKKQMSPIVGNTIVRKSNQAIEATLTPAQKQPLEADRRQHPTTAQSPIE